MHGLEDSIRDAGASDAGAAPLPIWVLGPRNDVEMLSYVISPENGGFEAKRRRFVGIQYAGSSDPEKTERNAWLQRMKREYQPTPAIEAEYSGTENFYDAVYWLAYGLVAAGPGAPATGTSFKEGVRKMLEGPKIIAGPDNMGRACQLIGSGASTTFEGALGPPDIDTASGT